MASVWEALAGLRMSRSPSAHSPQCKRYRLECSFPTVKIKLLKVCCCLIGRFLMKEVENQEGFCILCNAA